MLCSAGLEAFMPAQHEWSRLRRGTLHKVQFDLSPYPSLLVLWNPLLCHNYRFVGFLCRDLPCLFISAFDPDSRIASASLGLRCLRSSGESSCAARSNLHVEVWHSKQAASVPPLTLSSLNANRCISPIVAAASTVSIINVPTITSQWAVR